MNKYKYKQIMKTFKTKYLGLNGKRKIIEVNAEDLKEADFKARQKLKGNYIIILRTDISYN